MLNLAVNCLEISTIQMELQELSGQHVNHTIAWSSVLQAIFDLDIPHSIAADSQSNLALEKPPAKSWH